MQREDKMNRWIKDRQIDNVDRQIDRWMNKQKDGSKNKDLEWMDRLMNNKMNRLKTRWTNR